MNFNDKYEEYKQDYENKLYAYIDGLTDFDDNLISAMKYSVKAGGKRIRPILMLEISKLLEVEEKDVLPFAIAIELIHTYSLIHDDLPAMDNDDYRRGKLTNHKVFGEATAILAGDALLNLAYEICFKNCNDIFTCNASKILSNFAGFRGMIGGQAVDVKENKGKTAEVLNYIHENKTAKLIMASCMIPSCLKADIYLEELRKLGYDLGIAFQICDDILDYTSSLEVLGKSVGKDELEDKLTYVTLFGLDDAKNKLNEYKKLVEEDLKIFPECEFLKEFIDYLFTRGK